LLLQLRYSIFTIFAKLGINDFGGLVIGQRTKREQRNQSHDEKTEEQLGPYTAVGTRENAFIKLPDPLDVHKRFPLSL
jgi:hypothetical protein